jgi:hypothetical protein
MNRYQSGHGGRHICQALDVIGPTCLNHGGAFTLLTGREVDRGYPFNLCRHGGHDLVMNACSRCIVGW